MSVTEPEQQESEQQEWPEDQDVREPLYAAVIHGAPAPGGGAVDPALAALPEPERRSAHWLGWSVVSVTLGVIIGFGMVGYLKYVDGPVESKPSKSLAEVHKSVAPTPVPPNLLSGLAIEFQYPSIFDTLGQVKNDKQALEQYNIGSKADYSRTIAVDVRPLTSGQLEDDSSFRFRQLNTTDYTITPDKIGAEPVMLADKHDKSERTLFWAHQGKEVTVALTSTNPRDDLVTIMAGIKSSLRWRQ